MNLFSLLRAAGLPAGGQTDLEIETITERSNCANPTSLFVCIRGSRADGHTFAKDAYARGCRAFLAEKDLGLPCDASVTFVPDTHPVLGKLASALREHPSKRLKVIGITGTKGKTTTALFLSEILNRAGIFCGYIGTNGIAYGSRHLETANTTPDAVTLQNALADMADCGCKAVVLEVSSQAILLNRVAGTSFDACLFTNFSKDHIGATEHPTMEDYFACKHRLFTDFGAKTVIANLDDPMALHMMEGHTGELLTCSISGKATCQMTQVEAARQNGKYGITYRYEGETENADGFLPFLGLGNAYNALLAISAAERLFGISPAFSASVLQTASVAGRSEQIDLPNGVTAVIDYAHNGASLRQLLSALRAYRPKRLICLFGSVGERTELRRAELGEAAAELCDLAILTSDNPGKEDPEAIIASIAKAFEGSKTPYLCIPDRHEAIEKAVLTCERGDLLVLAGKGHESEQKLNGVTVPFCEKDILTEIANRPMLSSNK